MKHGRNLLGLRCDVRMMHDATWKARRSGTRTKRGEPSSFFTSFFEDDCPRDLSTSPVTSLKHETSVMQHHATQRFGDGGIRSRHKEGRIRTVQYRVAGYL